MPGEPEKDPAGEELAAMIGEIRERVRAGCPEGSTAGGVALPDLVPLLQARDAAEAKVAAIGSINPRRAGFWNNAIQSLKRVVSRLLAWHVREQVEFNRASLAAIEAALEALNTNNRALARLVELRGPWAEWRARWEQRLASTESQLLRTMAEVKTAFDFRLAQAAEEIQRQIGQTSEDIQRRMWGDLAILRADFDRTRAGYERLIHTELRLIRRREALPPAVAEPSRRTESSPLPPLDYASLAERFRGSEEYVREKQRFYLPFFTGRRDVLDLGCGRGEFLELMREAGVPACGIDLSAELVGLCRAKGLEAQCGDLLTCLPALPDESLDGVFCAHVVEHLPMELLPGMIRSAAAKLRRDGVLAIETPNPECLAIFATHFYLDPTHVRPVPPALLSFYLEESGLGRIEVHRLSPAGENAPSLASLPPDFREAFFGGQDYAIIGRKI